MKRLLGILVVAGILGLMVWGAVEARKEIALEREREKPILVPPRLEPAPGGGILLRLDSETQTRAGICVEILKPMRKGEEAPSSAMAPSLPSAPEVLRILDAEDGRPTPAREETGKVAEGPVGLLVPASALLRLDGKAWVYVRASPETFARRKVHLGQAAPGGWILLGGVSGEDPVVVEGAQTLLSEELKDRISAPEEGD